MIKRLQRLSTWVRNRFSRHGRQSIPQLQPPTGAKHGNAAGTHQTPVIQALHNIFTPQHKSEDEVCFQPIDQDGRFPEKGEEFRRDGNTRSARFRRTFVETVSGSVVPPDRVRGRCQLCHGFEDEAAVFCAACGKCCCRRCQRRFFQGTTEVVLCVTDFRAARDAINTWEARDRASTNSGTSS